MADLHSHEGSCWCTYTARHGRCACKPDGRARYQQGRKQAKAWLDSFLEARLSEAGPVCLPTRVDASASSLIRQASEQTIRIMTGPMGRIQSASWSAHQWPDTPRGEPAFKLLILALFNRAKHGGWNDRARLASMPSVQCDVHLIGLNAIRSASRGVDSSICTTSQHARIHSNSSSLHVKRGGCSSHHD